eukprot:Seg1748.4 transcript_id=Seg1748.4/GoldUCD/mRNA.D3Y31 product=5'-nucleotidase protein_id=Seg1748.4/GoldUCD/D3Y31
MQLGCESSSDDYSVISIEDDDALVVQDAEPVTRLLQCARDGNISELKTLLVSKTVNVDAVTEREKACQGLTALHYAVRHNHPRCVKVLLEFGADVNKTDNFGFRPIHDACLHGNPETLKLLLKYGASVDGVKRDGLRFITPVFYAAQQSQLQCMNVLSSNKIKLDDLVLWDLSSKRGNLEILEYLMDNVIPGDELSHWIHNSALAGQGNFMQHILRTITVNLSSDIARNALFIAARHGHVQYLAALLEYGVDPNLADENKLTALHNAARYGQIRCITELIQSGANTEALTDEKWTPLHVAVRQCQEEAVTVLIEMGADINAKGGPLDETPLHLAASIGDAPVLKNLLEANPNLVALDKSGKSVFQYEIRNGSGTRGNFHLTVLHTNDVHARIEQTNKYGGRCTPRDLAAKKCFGGVARRQTVIKKYRRTDPHVLLLDAGDQLQGTVWFTVYKGKASAFFMNQLRYDAMAIGNHELDRGPSKLVEFLRLLKFPAVCSNMDVSREPTWPKSETLFTKSKIIEIGGEKIAIVGYLTKDTTWLSYPGKNIRFKDEIAAIRREVNHLKAKGINKFIALGHSGIEMDIAIAKNIPDIDIVVGGHTNTFLYTGKKIAREDIYGPYPYIVNPTDRPEKKILVVQDYAYGKYLGHLKVTFDSNGEIIHHSGNPILLGMWLDEDQHILREIAKRKAAVDAYAKRSLGTTHVFLDGRRTVCRVRECNMGNLITDALVDMSNKHSSEEAWADAAIALWASGGIRSTIDKKPDQPLTQMDILEVLPYGNQADIIELKGEHLMAALEHSVSGYNPKAPRGNFLQMSGIHVQYDINRPVGQRVVKATARCAKCRVPIYKAIDKNKVYKIITSTWLRKGGDNFQMFEKNRIKLYPGEDAVNLVMEYIKKTQPIGIGLDGRIIVRQGK